MSPRLAGRFFSGLDKSALLRLLLSYDLRPIFKSYFLHPPKIRSNYFLHPPLGFFFLLPKKGQYVYNRNNNGNKNKNKNNDQLELKAFLVTLLLSSPKLRYLFSYHYHQRRAFSSRHYYYVKENTLAFRNRHHKVANSDLFYQHWRPVKTF